MKVIPSHKEPSTDTMAMMEPRVLELLGGIQEQMAAQRAWQDAQTRNIERFWANDWPRVVTNIERLATRLERMEHEIALVSDSRARIHDQEGRIRTLEQSSVRISAQAAIIAAVVALAVPLLGRYFLR